MLNKVQVLSSAWVNSNLYTTCDSFEETKWVAKEIGFSIELTSKQVYEGKCDVKDEDWLTFSG